MNLSKIAMTIEHANQKVKVIDGKSGRIRFEGTAAELLDFTGCEYCHVTDLRAAENTLILIVRSA